MNLTIDEKTENVLLHRTEIQGQISFDKTTPSNSDVREAISKELKVDSSTIVVKNIYTKFSHREATFSAVAYDSVENMNKTEMMTKHLKKKAAEVKKAADEKKAKAEEKKEAPQEKKEEPKAEEKPAEEKKEAPQEKKEEPKAEEKPAEEKKEAPQEKKEEPKVEEQPAEEKKEEKQEKAE